MAITEGSGYPIAILVESASPGEATLVEQTIAKAMTKKLPTRMIGDKAYDSDKLDRRLKEEHGIELIAPNRINRRKTQDGRQSRRYKKRWKVERFFSWLQTYRHIVTRYDRYVENYLSMIFPGCSMMYLNLILR